MAAGNLLTLTRTVLVIGRGQPGGRTIDHGLPTRASFAGNTNAVAV
jgi:hypothetical protein